MLPAGHRDGCIGHIVGSPGVWSHEQLTALDWHELLAEATRHDVEAPARYDRATLVRTLVGTTNMAPVLTGHAESDLERLAPLAVTGTGPNWRCKTCGGEVTEAPHDCPGLGTPEPPRRPAYQCHDCHQEVDELGRCGCPGREEPALARIDADEVAAQLIDPAGWLKPDELTLIELLGAAFTAYTQLGDQSGVDGDLAEWGSRIHDLQARVMARAAHRAYPTKLRML